MRRIAYSTIRRYENCNAAHIYYKILPRMESIDTLKIFEFGATFHDWAENNFSDNSYDEIVEDRENHDYTGFAEIIKSRDYFDLPHINEMRIEYLIKDDILLYGFPDRISLDLERNKLIIIDYKTSFEPNIDRDIMQLYMYAYIIQYGEDTVREMLKILSDTHPDEVEKIEKFLIDFGPEDIELCLDYVKTDFEYRDIFNLSKLKKIERWILINIRKMGITEDYFEKTKDIKRINHSDGDCNICFMAGKCLPYTILKNSYYDTNFYQDIEKEWEEINSIPNENGIIIEVYRDYDIGTPIDSIKKDMCFKYGIDKEKMDTQNLIELTSLGLVMEHKERQRILNINTKRLESIKKALELRHNNEDVEVTSRYKKQQNRIETYDGTKVMHKIVKKILKKSLRDIKFKELVDLKQMENLIVENLLAMSGKNLRKTNIPVEYHKDIEPFKNISYTRPFLREIK